LDCLKAQTCIASYVEEELTGNELKEFLAHMEQCGNCKEELEIYEGIITTSNFSRELDEKMESQRQAIARYEKLSKRVYGLSVLLGILFILWFGILLLDLTVPFFNPKVVTWEEEKQFVERATVPYMFQSVDAVERMTGK
jgi:anti-sigma factor RsiW